jgi:hypothetical protein
MSTFKQIAEQTRPPGKTLMLEPWVFADEWNGKPRDAVCVGLRIMPEGEKSKVRAEAERLADELHPDRGPNWVDAFNDCLTRQYGALGICSPNDVTRPSEILPLAEDQVRFALTTRGSQFIFEALQRYEIEASPIGLEADADDCVQVAVILQDADPSTLSGYSRRLIYALLEELTGDE